MQGANFVVTGLLVLAFAVGLRPALRRLGAGLWAPVLIGLVGVGLVGKLRQRTRQCTAALAANRLSELGRTATPHVNSSESTQFPPRENRPDVTGK
jgi:hypothetical protein